VHQAGQVGAHRGEVATVGQPAVEGPGDDLPAHRGADHLDAGALRLEQLLLLLLEEQRRLQRELVDREALVGAVAAAGGGAAAQLRPARSTPHEVQDRVGGSWKG